MFRLTHLQSRNQVTADLSKARAMFRTGGRNCGIRSDLAERIPFLDVAFRVDCSIYTSTAIHVVLTYSSETSDAFQRTTRCYIREDRTHHNHYCEEPHILCYSLLPIFYVRALLDIHGGTMLQAGRSWVGISMRLLDVFTISLLLSAALWLWGWLSLERNEYHESSWGKRTTGM
jgi:hypothetical protein